MELQGDIIWFQILAAWSRLHTGQVLKGCPFLSKERQMYGTLSNMAVSIKFIQLTLSSTEVWDSRTKLIM